MPYSEAELESQCAAPGCTNQLPEPTPRPRTRTYNREAEPQTDMRTVRRQRITCSAACRQRLRRERLGFKKDPRPCVFCGELVWDYTGMSVRCPENDRTDECDDLQYQAEARRDYVADRRTQRTAECEADGCDRPVTWSGKGRVKTTCSPRCRQRVRRARLREENQ